MGIDCESTKVWITYRKKHLINFVEKQRDYFARILWTPDCYADLRKTINNMLEKAGKENRMKETISEFIITHTNHDIIDLLL